MEKDLSIFFLYSETFIVQFKVQSDEFCMRLFEENTQLLESWICKWVLIWMQRIFANLYVCIVTNEKIINDVVFHIGILTISEKSYSKSYRSLLCNQMRCVNPCYMQSPKMHSELFRLFWIKRYGHAKKMRIRKTFFVFLWYRHTFAFKLRRVF